MSTPEQPPKRTVRRDGKSYQATRRPKPHSEPEAATEGSPQPGNSGRNPDGTFAKGNAVNLAGKPRGARHRATIIAEELIDGSGELLVKKCVEMALAGDAAAMRLAMERLCPPRRERPVNIALPKISAASDWIAAAAALIDAAASGDITRGEAASLSQLVGNVSKAIETIELAERLFRLEEQIAAKGGNP
jgi:hypothetical protein